MSTLCFSVSIFFHADTFSTHFPVSNKKPSLQRATREGPVRRAARELVLQAEWPAGGGPRSHRHKCPSLLQISPTQRWAHWLWFGKANHLSSSLESFVCNGRITTLPLPLLQAVSASRIASVCSLPWQWTGPGTTKSTAWGATVRQAIRAVHVWVTPSFSHLHPHQKLPDLDLRQLLARQTQYFSSISTRKLCYEEFKNLCVTALWLKSKAI